ncbi:MAG: hypothetical protein RLY16_36, partial [Bacteroidota bacterium]
ILQYLPLEQHQFLQPSSQLTSVLSRLYLIGLIFYFTRGLYHYNKLPKQTIAFSAAPLIDLRIFTENWALRMGISQKIKLALSEQIDVPQVIGHLKPIIYIPIALINQLNTKQLELIILHELTHIKRKDYIINLFQSIIESILFFNPFTHLISKQIRLEREKACDETVLNFPYPRKEYAEALFIAESFRQQRVRLAMAATGNKKQLLQRIKNIMTGQPASEFPGQRKWVFTILLTCLGFAFYILPLSNHSETFTQLDISSSFTRNLLPSLPIHQAFSAPKNQVIKSLAQKLQVGDITQTNKQKRTKSKSIISNKTAPTNQPSNAETGTIALINEDLLNGTAFNSTNSAVPVHSVEGAQNEDWLVKVEEEVSGSSQKRTTYYKAEIKNGEQILTPLFITAPIKKAKSRTKSSH